MKKRSGKFVFRTSPDLHEHLKLEAYKNQISMNQLINMKLQKRFTEYEDKFHEIQKFFGHALLGAIEVPLQSRDGFRTDYSLIIILDERVAIRYKLIHRWESVLKNKIHDFQFSSYAHLPKDPQKPLEGLWLDLAIYGELVMDPSGRVRQTLIEIRELIAKQGYQMVSKNEALIWHKPWPYGR